MNKKNIWLGIPAIVLAVTIGVIGCVNDTPDDNGGTILDFTYTEEENGTITITKYIGTGSSVTIPAQIKEKPVTRIGDRAFSGCTSLVNVTIPDSVTSMWSSAFWDCTSLAVINTDSGNTAYSSADGVLYNKNKTILIRYPQGKTGSTFSIPTSVTNIWSSAFYSCTNLTGVTILDSVTTIDSMVFYGCTSLTGITVDVSNPNYSSADGILYNKAKTGIILVPKGITDNVTIPNSVTSIGNSAFSGCSSLTSVTIGNSGAW